MIKKVVFAISYILILITSCQTNDNDFEAQIPEFSFPKTISFQSSLSDYNIFEGTASNLIPSDDFELLELSASLFTDYSYKQRLVKVPKGTSITKLNDGSLDFPNGTILTKTFFYYKDERDTSLGKRIIETRLEVKESETWNIATYIWNESQTDATLSLDGQDTAVLWTNLQGNNISTLYHIPAQNECMTCHQSNSTISPIGPTLLNLNKAINRNGKEINQLIHLQSLKILDQFSITNIPQIVNYKDINASLSKRGRSYLAMNCAHCHNPSAWNTPAEKDFDFRYEVPFDQTGIQNGKDKISRNIINLEMPFIGTTIMDEEGIAMLIEYLNSL